MRFTVTGHSPTHLSTRNSRIENDAGEIIGLGSESRSLSDHSTITATISGDTAMIVQSRHGAPRSSRLTMPSDTRFDGGDAVLPPKTVNRSFNQFDLAGLAIERVVLEKAGEESWQGETVSRIIRKTYEGDELRSVSVLLVDGKGQLVRTTQSMLGMLVAIEPVAKPIPASALSSRRIVPHQMIASPYRISTPALAGHIRYRFGFRGGMAIELPQTGEQRVTGDGDGVLVDICGHCGPGVAKTATALAKWREPSAWIESGSQALIAAAAPVARSKQSDRAKMRELGRIARARLSKVDFEGHYSALDAWRRRAGDCTEDAVVLAALGRAAGIPTRVANGVVYSREAYHGVSNAFMPHSWTLAYVDGAWESFDISLDGFDATHVALTLSDGDARAISAANQFASLLDWRQMAEVRPRPKP